MKTLFPKFFLFLLSNLFALSICRAQAIVDYAQVGLMKADYNHRAVLYIGNSQKAAIAILGPPSSRSTEYSEMDNTNFDVFNYGSSKLYFSSDALVTYDISTPTIAVGKNYASSFRVGNNRGTGSTFYGLAVKTTPDTSGNFNYSSIALAGLKSGGTGLDNSIRVLFDANGNVYNISLTITN
jgi:hypothetical protein